MAYYEQLMKVNIAEAVQRMGLKMDYDGKVRIPYHLELESPWIEQGACPKRECLLWKDIFFDNFRVIHPGCMSCWKTYYVPQSVKELFEIYEIQKDNAQHGIVPSCKCGVETRPYTGRLGGYGAFWYNPLGCGLEEARKNTEKLSAVYKRKLLLKRGCTEMEQYTIRNYRKPSSEWVDFLKPSKEKLQILDLTFLVDPTYRTKRRPIALRLKTEALWIRYAFEHGDKTYREYTDGPMAPTLEQYRNSIHNEKDIDDGTVWEQYRTTGINQERVGGLDGKQEKALITSLEGIE